MKTEITSPAAGIYQVIKTDERTGKTMDAEVITADKAMDAHAIGTIIGQTVKSHGAFRAGALSFLGMIYQSSRLDGFKGTADRVTGKIAVEFKAAVRSVEEDVVKALVEGGHIKLPKAGNPEENFQAFMSTLRDDKNYSNAKVTTNKYFAFVGGNCVEEGFIIPVPVMNARIADVVERPAVDHSIASKLKAIKEQMDKGTIPADDAIDSLAYTKELLSTLQGVVNYYAELATGARQGVDVAANAMIEKASMMPVGTRTRVQKEAAIAA